MKKATHVIGSNGKKYRLEKKLGQGVTSEVYRGVDEATGTLVALKMLRSGVSDIIANNFWLEGTILGALGRAELGAEDGLSNVPRLLDSQRQDARFLVLEFVTGTPITRLLEESSHLTEQDALEVANQVLRVLHLLHQQVRRTYTDFQLQNIWLQESANGLLVKVMDWNHVSDKVPDGQPLPDDFGAQDLARFGAYFYRMLTGKGADERGESERALEKRAGKRWQEVSLGTRQIVIQALHPNPARRYPSAAEFRQAVQTQQQLWQSDWIDLLGDVRNALSSEQEALEASQANVAAAKVDIAKRLNAPPEQINHYQRQLEQKTGQVSLNWQAGWQYYSAGQYRTALNKWREEAEAQGRVELWRWVMVAQAGVELGASFASVREPLEKAVQALLEDQVTQAQQILQALKSTFDFKSVEALKNEVFARQAIAEAKEHEGEPVHASAWQQAAQLYRRAEAALQKIPYQELLRDEEGWVELNKRADQLDKKWSTRRQTGQTEEEIRRLLDRPATFERGVKKLTNALRSDPTNRQLVQLCLDEGQKRLEMGQTEQAIKLLEVGALWAQVPDLADKLEQALGAIRAEQQRKQEEEQRIATPQADINRPHKHRTVQTINKRDERAPAATVAAAPWPKWMLRTMMALLLLLLLLSTFTVIQGVRQDSQLATVRSADTSEPTEEIAAAPDTSEPTEAPEIVPAILTMEALPATLYDIPTVRGSVGEGWSLQVYVGGQLQIISASTKPNTVISEILVKANDIPVTGTISAKNNKRLTWTPNPDDPPLAPGSYTLTLQGRTNQGQLLPLITPVALIVQPAPFTATLAQQRLHTQPYLEYQYLFDGVDGRPPSPAAVGTQLEVLARGPAVGEAHLFLQVRIPPQRLTYWALYPSSADNGQPNLNGITPEQVDSLPTIGR